MGLRGFGPIGVLEYWSVGTMTLFYYPALQLLHIWNSTGREVRKRSE